MEFLDCAMAAYRALPPAEAKECASLAAKLGEEAKTGHLAFDAPATSGVAGDATAAGGAVREAAGGVGAGDASGSQLAGGATVANGASLAPSAPSGGRSPLAMSEPSPDSSQTSAGATGSAASPEVNGKVPSASQQQLNFASELSKNFCKVLLLLLRLFLSITRAPSPRLFYTLPFEGSLLFLRVSYVCCVVFVCASVRGALLCACARACVQHKGGRWNRRDGGNCCRCIHFWDEYRPIVWSG